MGGLLDEFGDWNAVHLSPHFGRWEKREIEKTPPTTVPEHINQHIKTPLFLKRVDGSNKSIKNLLNATMKTLGKNAGDVLETAVVAATVFLNNAQA